MACTPRNHERLVELARGDLGGADADSILEHALACPACGEDLDFLADLTNLLAKGASARAGPAPAAAAEEGLRARRPVTIFTPRRRALAAAALILIAALGGLVATFRPRGGLLRDLADIRPVPFVGGTLRAPAPREAPEEAQAAADREARFRDAMEAYGREDFAGAGRGLERLLAEDPADHKLRIYLGVSRLQLGQIDGALEVLDPAAREAPGLLGERALWYSGMAHLLREDGAAARRAFEDLRARGGSYRRNAEEVLGKLAARAP